MNTSVASPDQSESVSTENPGKRADIRRLAELVK